MFNHRRADGRSHRFRHPAARETSPMEEEPPIPTPEIYLIGASKRI